MCVAEAELRFTRGGVDFQNLFYILLFKILCYAHYLAGMCFRSVKQT